MFFKLSGAVTQQALTRELVTASWDLYVFPKEVLYTLSTFLKSIAWFLYSFYIIAEI